MPHRDRQPGQGTRLDRCRNLKTSHNVETDRGLRSVAIEPREGSREERRVLRLRAARVISIWRKRLQLKDVDASAHFHTRAFSFAHPERWRQKRARIAMWRSRWAMCWQRPKAARDAVLQNKRIVQVGTQHRSEPYPMAAHDLVQSWSSRRRKQGRKLSGITTVPDGADASKRS